MGKEDNEKEELEPSSLNSIAHVNSKLLGLSGKNINEVQLHIVRILAEDLSLTACSFFSSSSTTDRLTLRGQVGFRYRDYASFTLPRKTIAGTVFETNSVEIFTDLEKNEGFLDKALIIGNGLSSVVVMPVSMERNGSTHVVSSICMYPKNLEDLAKIKIVAEEIRRSVEAVLQFATSHTFNVIRAQMVQGSLSVTDPNSFLHKALTYLKGWGFEGATFFVHDERADCLRLAATTGLSDSGIRKTNAFYRMNETEHLTVQAYHDQSPKLIEKEDIEGRGPKYREKTDSEFYSALALPFFAPKFNSFGRVQEERCYGVLRLTNKTIVHNDHKRSADFTWEDSIVIDSFLDVSSVVVHMFKRVEAKSNEFERVVHSLENNVLTVLGALHNIDDFVSSRVVFPEAISHSLPNSLAFMQSIHEQVRVFKIRDGRELPETNLHSTKLYGEVISKLPTYAQTIAQCYAVQYQGLDLSDFHHGELSKSRISLPEKYMEIPNVMTDSELLLTVFKNLIENSVKYSQPARPCKIVISWELRRNFVVVHVTDNGIGVPDTDAEYIFNETYQAENAMRRRTSGAGIGLYQCAFIMHYIKGDIRYKKMTSTTGMHTRFSVSIPTTESLN